MKYSRTDLTGLKIGDWEVLKRIIGKKPTRYLCRCKCGIERKIPYPNLLYGRSNRCIECRNKNQIGKKRIYLYKHYRVVDGIIKECRY